LSLVLADTSVWSRAQQQPPVAAALAEALEANALTIVLPVTLELLRSARDRHELETLARELDALHQVEVTAEIGARARSVQAALAHRGHHRGPSPTDLVAAAAAEAVGAELWHCDRHPALIAELTEQPARRLGR
jgi:predicted nucleic acid-binding protein